jgi:hypothetical protein
LTVGPAGWVTAAAGERALSVGLRIDTPPGIVADARAEQGLD